MKGEYMENRVITDLVSDALESPDYSFRINFLLAELMSAETNDTPEKEAINKRFLQDIRDYLSSYSGEKKTYASRICAVISGYLENHS